MSSNVKNNRTVDAIPTSHRLKPSTIDQKRKTYDDHHINDETRNKLDADLEAYRPKESSRPVIQVNSNANIDPEIEKDINENPDWKLDLERSEYKGSEELKVLDGNLNSLMAIVRHTLAVIQQSQNTNESARINELQEEVRQKLLESKGGTLGQSRLSFAKGIAILTMSIMPQIKELSDESKKELFNGILKSVEPISDIGMKGYDASIGEVKGLMNLIEQKIHAEQKQYESSRRIIASADDSLARAAANLSRVQV